MVITPYSSRLSGVYSFMFFLFETGTIDGSQGGVSNGPSQIQLDGSHNHQPCIFKVLITRSRTGTDLQQYLTYIFIRQILHQIIAFILILLSSISITQFRQYNTNLIFIQHNSFTSRPDMHMRYITFGGSRVLRGPYNSNDNNTANKIVMVISLQANKSLAFFLLCWLKDVIIVLGQFLRSVRRTLRTKFIQQF